MNFNTKIMEIKRGECFKLHGRPYYVNDVPMFTWSNSGIEFDALCDRMTVFFGENTAQNPVMFKIFIDNLEYKTSVMGKEVTAVIEKLKYKLHHVKILRISEGSNLIGIEKVQIYGKCPEFSMPDEKNKLKLEFIGDSITAGFGLLAERNKPDYTTYEQDSTLSYAYLTAKALDADIRSICISGQGICHSCGEYVGTPFIKFFNLASRAAEDCTRDDYVPDVFIVNGGTNDKRSHVTSEEFIAGVKTLLCDIRSKYPKTPIIWMYGMMLHVFDEELKTAVSEVNESDKNTHLLIVKSVSQCKDEVGTCGHPNVNASQRCSKLLVKKIKEVLQIDK